MSFWVVVSISILYLGILFGIAYLAERNKSSKRTFAGNPYSYALALAIYCTAWTFYGSVGKATEDGVLFLAVYFGPTIGVFLMLPVIGKIIRISRFQRITSLADFISSRYGKNTSIGVVVTILSLIGVVPYISLQIKAISTSFTLLTAQSQPSGHEIGLYITIVMAIFIILFGTRSSDATEKHEGLLSAIAFESIVKLVALTIAGIFVTYFLYDGMGDIFQRAQADASLQHMFTLKEGDYVSWFFLLLTSMMAFFFLPRQFQVAVVENDNESNNQKSVWLIPLYMLLINIFILPIAFAGKLHFGDSPVSPDTYVLSLPLHTGHELIGLLIFIGGFSAASGMIIVETIALSTMISNSLVMPIWLGVRNYKKGVETDFSKQIISIRRWSIVLILFLAFVYEQTITEYVSLVSVGLVSFAAVTQFAPAVIAGIYWKQASRIGALVGIISGFLIWFYTLVIPSLADSGIIHQQILTDGPFGITWLNPVALFGLEGFDPLSHALFWSLFVNCSLFTFFSLYSKKNTQEIYQADLFVNIHKHAVSEEASMWKRTALLPDLNQLLDNFLGKERAANLIRGYATRNQISMNDSTGFADPRLVDFSERILSGVIGAAAARIMVASVTKEEEVSIDEVLKILQESQQIRELNKELRKKSIELQKATEELRQANQQLKDIDALKDEFLYTVTHELRTPLTAIRAMSEIVLDNPEMEEEQRSDFLGRIVNEIERLSHLITQVLYLERYESGRQKLNLSSFSAVDLGKEVFHSLSTLAQLKHIHFELKHPNSSLLLHADKDLLQQVLTNLLSNAIKFTPENGHVFCLISEENEDIHFIIQDNGKGIPTDEIPFLFDKFFQARNQTLKKPEGSGLGLAISRQIVEMHGGKIWVESEEGKGARFEFIIPNFAENIPSE